MHPELVQRHSIQHRLQGGGLEVTFKDREGADFTLFVPIVIDRNDLGNQTPLLRRHALHQFTDKFSGGQHVYATSEDTPMAWDEAQEFLSAIGADVAAQTAFVSANGNPSPPPGRTLEEILQSTGDCLFPADIDREITVTIASRASDDDSPLHVLLWRHDGEGVLALIAAGADVNASGDMGETPLHIAVKNNLPEAVAALLDAGADPDRRSEFGDTARELAREKGALTKLFETRKPR